MAASLGYRQIGIDGFAENYPGLLYATTVRLGYHRQFITRKIDNHRVLARLEQVLSVYFDNEELLQKGIPTVSYIAEQLHISPNYLSGLLKVLTG